MDFLEEFKPSTDEEYNHLRETHFDNISIWDQMILNKISRSPGWIENSDDLFTPSIPLFQKLNSLSCKFAAIGGYERYTTGCGHAVALLFNGTPKKKILSIVDSNILDLRFDRNFKSHNVSQTELLKIKWEEIIPDTWKVETIYTGWQIKEKLCHAWALLTCDMFLRNIDFTEFINKSLNWKAGGWKGNIKNPQRKYITYLKKDYDFFGTPEWNRPTIPPKVFPYPGSEPYSQLITLNDSLPYHPKVGEVWSLFVYNKWQKGVWDPKDGFSMLSFRMGYYHHNAKSPKNFVAIYLRTKLPDQPSSGAFEVMLTKGFVFKAHVNTYPELYNEFIKRLKLPDAQQIFTSNDYTKWVKN